ncbi:MAG: 50S ribosomal protein L32 [Candidatus Liptonbacteria bacterium RIFCSPHIGHO2_01_FULL_57_28]|uniref:Large ribosomal subunit protein bL32 n=1 Tax=Candidatus Liptonbacteria bacterium RIFCSPHIGHO2_01_FULL_57_28 TaxID=1798647 RepID=A0A1G2CBL6_9BACT|nr:MAG: 50S ribosomal protein L32 [Candidatus Liptonbacteria bacterium RIFCSPHIGHO2_01_FULL_57_28]
MGGVPTKHHSRGKTRRRRSHLALVSPKLIACPNCKMPALPHRACANCGKYVKKARTKKEVSV